MSSGNPKERWRVGTTVPINVYAGDRPVCQCHNFMDALLITQAVNKMLGHGASANTTGSTHTTNPEKSAKP